MHMISDFEFVTRPSFKTGGEFREAVRKYAIKQVRYLKFMKKCSDKIQVTCECG